MNVINCVKRNNKFEHIFIVEQICSKTFSRRPHLQEHMILHTQDRPFKCSFCDEYFRSRFARLKHQEKYHLGEKYVWCKSSLKVLNIYKMKNRFHIRILIKLSDRFIALILKFAMVNTDVLFCLMAGPFPCEICGRQFNDTGNKKRHIECTHGGKRKWTCFVCGKSVRERCKF